MLIRFKIKLLALTCLSLLLTSCEPDNGELIELNCSTASTSGTIIQGSPATNVILSIAYTGDGDGSYESQTIQSTGVLGLTATIPTGNFSDGSGTLSYTISGTPQSSGVASFAISVGGQSCTMTIPVNVAGSPATCGAPNVHNPNKTYGTLTDQEGNVYKTIVIGSQEWMAENLKTSTYRNGDAISNNLVSDLEWYDLTSEAWCHFNNDSVYDCPYGKLYNWYAATDERNICPSGWHLPSDSNWFELATYLGGADIAGSKLKVDGTQYWIESDVNSTNESGFSGLPSGIRYYYGEFLGGYESVTLFWTSKDLSGSAYAYGLSTSHSDLARVLKYKQIGASVRCIRD